MVVLHEESTSFFRNLTLRYIDPAFLTFAKTYICLPNKTSDLLPSADEQASHQLSERDRALSTLKRVPGIGYVDIRAIFV